METCLAKEGEGMAEEMKQEKKKVYVETTVVSDATALPARDVVQLGRQVVTREWWRAMCVLTSAHRRCFRKEAVNDAGKTI